MEAVGVSISDKSDDAQQDLHLTRRHLFVPDLITASAYFGKGGQCINGPIFDKNVHCQKIIHLQVYPIFDFYISEVTYFTPVLLY